MKKLLLILLLLLVGCENKEDTIKISYDNSYYQVAVPYKENIGSYNIRDYDKEEVESMLSKLSTEFFKTNNSLYQEGQFLTTDEIKNLVTEYNNTDKIEIDNVEFTPSYITTIYEQNYLATNNVLKGISLAIVVDNKQYYENNKYKVVNEEIVLDYALAKANDLISYMRSKDGLENINIVLFTDGYSNAFKNKFDLFNSIENTLQKYNKNIFSRFLLFNTYDNYLNSISKNITYDDISIVFIV